MQRASQELEKRKEDAEKAGPGRFRPLVRGIGPLRTGRAPASLWVTFGYFLRMKPRLGFKGIDFTSGNMWGKKRIQAYNGLRFFLPLLVLKGIDLTTGHIYIKRFFFLQGTSAEATEPIVFLRRGPGVHFWVKFWGIRPLLGGSSKNHPPIKKLGLVYRKH